MLNSNLINFGELHMNIYTTLINKQNRIPKNMVANISLVGVANSHGEEVKVENKTIEMYQKLKEACEEEGVFIGLGQGYRSEQEQENIYQEFCEKYGKEYADAIVAPVGTSEHHSGLAIDICISPDQGKTYLLGKKDEMMMYDASFKKVHEIAPRFGFILRYPEGKEKITGYQYEPWHLRYVGVKPAAAMQKNEQTLEEWHQSNTRNLQNAGQRRI